MNNHVIVKSQVRLKHQSIQNHYSHRTPEIVFPKKEDTSCHWKRSFSRHQGDEQKEQDQSCNRLAINDKIKANKLITIGEQITHLVQDPNIQIEPEPINTYARIKTILGIYWKLLNLSPLEFHMHSNDTIYNPNEFDILNSRLQVLYYIENLDGYCDAINKLRLILKSQTMISVMTAFNKITFEVEAKKIKLNYNPST